MPINLKELFIADTNQIRIEKINYNFDQIIAAGGQIGPKGLKGDFGPIGPEGEKGQKGDQGPVGSAGADGSDGVNYWDEIDHDSINGLVNVYNASILKPVTFGKTHVTAVYLGDPNYSITDEGNTSPRSVLTIDKDDQFENHFKIVGTNANFVMRNEFFIDPNIYGGDVFSIKKDDVTGANPAKLDIAFNDVSINATGNSPKGILNLTSNNTIELTSNNGVIVNAGTVSNFNDRVFVNSDLIVTGTGFTKVSSGTTAQRSAIAAADLSGGCIRYNTTTNKLEARYDGVIGGSTWLPLRELTDADQDTRIEIPITSDPDIIRMYSNGNLGLSIGGSSISLTSTSAPSANLEVPITSNYTIFANKNIHISSFGKGLSFKQGGGGSSPAPNSNASVSRRTLHDYIEQPPVFFDDITSSNFVGTPLNAGDLGQQAYDVFSEFAGFSLDDAVTSNSIFTAGTTAIKTAFNGSTTKVAYTKIGNMITVTAYLRFSTMAYTGQSGWADPTQNGHLGIRLPGILDVYTPNSTVDMKIHMNQVHFLSNKLDDAASFSGRITSGGNKIRVYGERIATSTDVGKFQIYLGSIKQSSLQTGAALLGGAEFNFTFTYFTDDNSYEQPPTIAATIDL